MFSYHHTIASLLAEVGTRYFKSTVGTGTCVKSTVGTGTLQKSTG